MTIEQVLELLQALGEDVSYDVQHNNVIAVTFEDFEGFDEDWNEILRDYNNEEAIENFIETLETACQNCREDFYYYYYFEGFSVQVGYASFDI